LGAISAVRLQGVRVPPKGAGQSGPYRSAKAWFVRAFWTNCATARFSDEGIAQARKRLADRLGEFNREREAELQERCRKLDRVVNQIDKLVNFIADSHGSASIAESHEALNAGQARSAVPSRRSGSRPANRIGQGRCPETPPAVLS
jgi:hypothetical protein